MKISHLILVLVFFAGISFLNVLLPINVNSFIIALVVVYLLNKEDHDNIT